MSDATDPTWALVLWIILGGLGFGIVWTLLSIPIAALVGRVIARRREQDAQVYGPRALYGPLTHHATQERP